MSSRTPVRDRLEAALERIDDPAGEGNTTFLHVSRERARAAADAADQRGRLDVPLSPLDGVLVSIKDLLDVRGERTTAGSLLRGDAAFAEQDAPVVARLRAAGAVLVGRTNLSEFAFHGLGTNPHYGTPRNPADRTRVPGGSSSGAAVSVAEDMCDIAIGTDTAGSVRIPAAFCGLVGFKPTQERIPRTGVFPLSTTLDSVGPLTKTVEQAYRADAVMAGAEPAPLQALDPARLRVGLVRGEPLEGLDETVSHGFARAVDTLSANGVRLRDVDLPMLAHLTAVTRIAGFSSTEMFRRHQADIDTERRQLYDPFVLSRIERGRTVTAAQYLDMLEHRRAGIAAMAEIFAEIDLLVLPAAPIAAPRFDELTTVDVCLNLNAQLLRNEIIANFFDLCAITLPIPESGLPAGLLLMARHGADRQLFAAASVVESWLARRAK
jgi:aspartyl-tRNA(Asn)/glutamyl-tRNA(Gln) amidotransferase subunit A